MCKSTGKLFNGMQQNQLKQAHSRGMNRVSRQINRSFLSPDKAQGYPADKSFFDKIGDYALEKGLPELTKLIPMKELQDPTEKILRIGVNQLRGKAKPKRKPSAWNLKVKAYIKNGDQDENKDA